jgi:hypothetical protein
MGRVVEAFDTQLGRTVALKEVLPKAAPGAARRFVREVQITARLEHASIVPLYDSGTTVDGRPYYVMRKVSGRPLDEMIARAPAFRDRLALLSNLLSAIEAVAHAHRRGVIHRDLKPANILVGELGETVVIDWGLAKVIGEDDADEKSLEPRIPTAADSLQTQLGSVFGTPGFMPPEQARGDELGPRSDVFALGATLYTLLVGKPPVGGKSATEMLEATHKHAIVPVAEAAPGTPPELVAIVDKSIAFEAAARYANAGALAEDVRRFLTGQVVAAHRYTRRERIARFARRNRAVLSVSAIGLAILAVLAWVGVHRIVAERDAANEAKALAQDEKRQVDAANKQLEDHLDDLRVEQAKALVGVNPTKALAALKQVRAGYGKLDAARAVAEQAIARGVAWAIPTGTSAFWYELDQAGARITLASLTGEVRVFDLEARRPVLTRTYRRGVRASWIDGGKSLLVYGPGAPAVIIDPRDGTQQPETLPAMEYGMLDTRGMRILFADAQHAAWLHDFATHETRAIPMAGVRELAMAKDASWYAVADAKELVVYDRDGKEITRRPVGSHVVLFAGARKLATLDDRDIQELELDPAPHWTALKVPLEGTARVLQLAYRADRLIAMSTSAAFLVKTKDTFMRVPGDPGLSWDLVTAGDAAVAIAADGKVHYQTGYAVGELALPTAVANPRVVGREGASRLVVGGDGILVVYDLADFLPRTASTDHGGNVAFVDDDLVILHDQSPEWSWYDVAKDKVTAVPVPAWGWGESYLIDVDRERRALRSTTDRSGTHLSIARPEKPEHEVWRGPMTSALHGPRAAALIPGDAVAFGDGARVLTATGSEDAREVVKIDGNVIAVSRLGRLRYAALSARGELARGNVGGGDVERSHVDLGDTALLAADRDGHAIVATGKQLFVWDKDVHELAHVDQPIIWMAAVDGGIAVELADRRIVLVPASGAVRRLMTVGARPPAVSADGRVLVGSGNSAIVEIVELPSGASWSMSLLYGAPDKQLALSPTTRKLAAAGGGLAMWVLPEPRGSLGDWLGELTNACISGDVLAWPWENKCSP